MSGAARQFKDEAYGHLARVGKAVATASRLELLDLLAQAPRSVADLAEEAALSVPNASQHLKVLREVGLVSREREGNHVIYRLAGDDVSDFVVALQRLGHRRVVELEAAERGYFADTGEEVAAETLRAQISAGEVTVVDVRPAEEYDAGHIDGAINVPIDQLGRRVEELPREHPIVLYCRGPYCTFAARGVELLTEHGFRAVRLRDGYPSWRYSNATEASDERQ